MAEPSTKPTTNIVFPENITDIIFDILKNSGLNQTEDEIVEKRKKGETFYGAILGKLLKKIATEKISFEQFVDTLSQEMQIDKEKSQQIAQEAKIRILDRIDNPETQLEKKEPNRIQEELAKPKQKPNKSDGYREPIG
ncbi:MAG: hypothetical protein PHY72_03395 [Candidatus Pacebacteria bacterium]|nr:hypothetical protein [Candidatus Paceibacterota bacterium]